MALFRSSSSNPFIKESKFEKTILDSPAHSIPAHERMTMAGAINKTFILTAILMATGAVGFLVHNPLFTIVGALGGLITVIIAAFRPQNSAVLAPIYAAFEGLFVGAITFQYAAAYDGVVFNAAIGTVGMLAIMLALYKFNIIPVTQKLKTGIVMATASLALIFLVSWIASFFGMYFPMIHGNSMFAIGFSVVVVVIAAMNLLLDFDMIVKGDEMGAPKYMEWYSAMGLLITLVWLYIELLRLLSKISSRD